jgi:hypothetical protein
MIILKKTILKIAACNKCKEQFNKETAAEADSKAKQGNTHKFKKNETYFQCNF